MNRNIALALLKDAFAQVVDNMVFRIMMVLLAILVLPSFLISIQDDRFVVLFFIELPYEDIARYFGGDGSIGDGAKVDIIEGFQSLLLAEGSVNPLAWMGRSTVLMLCVFATAFFMPRTLEKGAADTIFSKPVSRLVLMLSRYFAGLLFVSLCVTFAIGGVHVGLLLRSGYSDPGWLWLIPELLYSFAVFHAFSVFVGVFTRSSVASILLTSMFFLGNGCTHFFWRTSLSEEVELAATAEEADEDLSDKVLSTMRAVFKTMHLVLPKTIDSRAITESLRARGEEGSFELADSASGLTIESPPAGFEREPRSSLARDGVLWIAPHPGSASEATLRLSKASINETGSRVALAKGLEKELEDEVPPAGVERTEIDRDRDMVAGRRADIVTWRERRAGEERLRSTSFFQNGEWIFTLEYDAEVSWAEDPARDELLEAFSGGMRFPEIDLNPPDEFERNFGWNAPLLYNGWFSIGSTLAFIALLLGLGWWKLSRIDF